MNSLVVLLSVVALAAAKPSGLLQSGGFLSVAPAASAITHQSRVDIKSAPAIVTSAAVGPIAKTIIAEPAVVSAPALIASPAAVSHQSRIDIKSSPSVVSTYAATVPLAYTAPVAAAIAPSVIKTYASPVIAGPAIASPALIRSSLVSPALIKSVGPVVPLDTPEVAAARAAHLQAKALAGAHLLRKRSAPLLTAAPLLSTYSAPLTYTAPLTYSAVAHAPFGGIATVPFGTPIVTRNYGLRAW